MSEKFKVLLVEDDIDWLEIYVAYLRDEDYIVDTARSINQAIDLLRQVTYDVVVTDLKMLGWNDEFGGFNILQRAKELSPDTQVIVITGYGSRDIALRAMQQGAFDYVTKPPERERFRISVKAAIQARQILSNRRVGPTKSASPAVNAMMSSPSTQDQIVLPGFIANSRSMRIVYERIIKAIDTPLPVFIYGEAGTGRGFIAKTIHINSQRRVRPFSQVICADLSASHWSVIARNLSNIRGGTLFFDGLDSLTEGDQTTLMELIPTIEMHGVRLIASATVAGDKEIDCLENIGIQPSLLQVIAHIPIWVPPLRARKDGDDIPALIGHFLHELTQEIEPTYQIKISSEAMRLLLEYDYRKGNIRELYNVIKQAVELLGGQGTILPDHLLLPGKLVPSEKLKILFVAADPSDRSRLRLGEEFREIKEQLMLGRDRIKFSLTLPYLSLRPKDIARALMEEQPQIVHFSGHGTAEGALCFEDENGQSHFVQPEALTALFKQFAGQVKCVILNACYAEAQAAAIARHIDYVIGMKREISDKAAIAFSLGFYQALGAGKAIEEAFEFGCIQIMLQGISENLTPVLIKKGQTLL